MFLNLRFPLGFSRKALLTKLTNNKKVEKIQGNNIEKTGSLGGLEKTLDSGQPPLRMIQNSFEKRYCKDC